MISQKIKTNSGFAALMSAIIISAILLLIATNLSFIGFYSRSDILDSELKERSSALAEACVDTALLELANNPNYAGDEAIIVFEGDTCIIQAINPDATPIIINTKAIFRQATTNLNVKANKADLFVVSWEEI